MNTYWYVSGNPLKLIDPLGLAAIEIPIPDEVVDWFPDWAANAGRRLAFWLTILTIPGDTPNNKCDEECPPCKTISGKIVPVGTIGYRPLDNPGRPQHGIDGPHYNLLKVNQIPKGNPVGECDCFWQPIGAVAPGDLPAGAIPAEPFNNSR